MGTAKHRVVSELGNPELRKRLVRIAGRVLRSEEDSEDAAHDAVVQALVAAERFRSDAQVTTWMHRIAVNASLMALRKSQRAHRHMGALGAAGVAGLPVAWAVGGEAASAENEMAAADSRVRVRQAVEKLPEEYRSVIEHCVYDEESAEEAAAALRLTPSAVRTRVGRARRRLQDLLVADVPVAA
ncbi:MAG: sigma-70 family RNA polymerase sigma factor [Deltaproteobacteria bacterium]|nr:sigma-70 family RNA polymerase sigma factor [Deltaproteobacteria bacterium]